MLTTIRLADIGRVVTGKTPPTKSPEYYGDDYPFITPTDIRDNTPAVAPARYISELGRERHRNAMLPSQSVCYTCIASVGKMCMTSRPSLTNQQINSIIVDRTRFDPRYVYYRLRVETPRILGIASGVATPIINKSMFSDVELAVHSLPTQKKIAAILSAYDDLIENNERRIRILEEMAQNLYREWFVKFRFPGHEKVKMVDSPLGKIPQGWEVKTIAELYETGSGGTPSRSRAEYFGGDMPWVKTRELNDSYIRDTEEKLTSVGLQNSSTKTYPRHTVVMAMYGATIGKLGILSIPATMNQACCALLPKTTHLRHVFIFLSLLEHRKRIVQLGQGAAQQNISQVVVKDYELLAPDKGTMATFNHICDSVFDCIEVLHVKNANLRQTRDLLLPKLVSGEVDLSSVNISSGC